MAKETKTTLRQTLIWMWECKFQRNDPAMMEEIYVNSSKMGIDGRENEPTPLERELSNTPAEAIKSWLREHKINTREYAIMGEKRYPEEEKLKVDALGNRPVAELRKGLLEIRPVVHLPTYKAEKKELREA